MRPSLLSLMCVSASLHALPLLILPQIIKDKCVTLTSSPVRPAVPSRLHASLPDTTLALEFSWQRSCQCAKQNGIRLGSPLTCGLSKARTYLFVSGNSTAAAQYSANRATEGDHTMVSPGQPQLPFSSQEERLHFLC